MNRRLETYSYFYSPIGKIAIASDGEFITRLAFCPAGWEQRLAYGENELLSQAVAQLAQYFAGTRRLFDLPLNPAGGTPFQRRVWAELGKIPYGAVWSYKELAQAVGNANASRAVGSANHANPIAIFIPCHRVIGANGCLTGYAGGLERKAFLLRLEKKGREHIGE